LVRIEKGSLAQEVMQQIMNYINAGRFPSGSKLPSSDELAQMFGVGRSSVREALKELQTLGIVTLKHGDGTYVCNFSSQKELGPMSYICEVRRMIEVYCADTGVEKASEEDLRELGEWLHFMEKHFDDDKLFIYYDRKFHFKITEITRNPVIMSILKSLEVLFDQLQHLLTQLDGQKARAMREHKEIYEAYKTRDKQKVLEAINRHHDGIMEGWVKVCRNRKIGTAG